eukprot:EG_transcript_15167
MISFPVFAYALMCTAIAVYTTCKRHFTVFQPREVGPDISRPLQMMRERYVACATTAEFAAEGDAAPAKAARKRSVATRARTPRPRKPSLTREYERSLVPPECKWIAGVDEVGRGPLAGPVVAAACMMPPEVDISGIRDSKLLGTEALREEVYEALTTHPQVVWGVAVVENTVIDEVNILQAALLAMDRAVRRLPFPPDFVLVDGNRLPPTLQGSPHAAAVCKGDSLCHSIAAASIIAKVTRDRIMNEHHTQYPVYNFLQHKGYPTAAHMAALRAHGPCPLHRMTFGLLKTLPPRPTAPDLPPQ